MPREDWLFVLRNVYMWSYSSVDVDVSFIFAGVYRVFAPKDFEVTVANLVMSLNL